MKIVILDGFTTNPGDLNWNLFDEFGTVKVYDRTPLDKIVSRACDAEIVFTNKTVLSENTLKKLPKLKFIGVLATGYNIVDVKAASSMGIIVCNVPSYSTFSVAQNVFSLLLDITNGVAHYSNAVRSGSWSECPDFSYVDTNLIELAGKKFGIIGFGNIGSRVAAIAKAFGMETFAFTSKPQDKLDGTVKMGLDEIFSTCDVISLHCPLTPKTENMVNSHRLSTMKRTAILINTGRGPLVDEYALAEALNTGRIYAAGLDVLCQEPPRKDNPLLTAKNCIITPHISWSTREARQRLVDISVENLRAFLSGNPINVVS